ncbi:uncharacterized protein K452DRAFT_355894 [Aplosporella prunicola CBS 121167]|uniref:tRNA(Ile)-lysidine synthetase n=1 Tax=Aplosporella prunicola CBS 121167 TaxID=1176127 RepID=A0A6A6BQB2_9PEZI|nr:uncharacterized protein K452DRAFT_355894 [Aplosporella prunicola CBS 121167]KAF2145434.1 hypothetical protein K452DRAFT_355894 [Aplosporella prunicola CBS 121167]
MFAPTFRLRQALPVSVAEFRESLAAIWLPRLGVQRPRLGLAVSGGADSMALATLCADLSEELGEEEDETDIFTAFIVDHQLRKGSTDEARTVQENLLNLGIDAEILQMQWPREINTQSLTNLETQARKLRFRLLGRACRDHGIESLLVAHHSDDQAETVMMRLIEGYRGMGLRGMKPRNEIPECFGVHGVHQSHAEWLTNENPLHPEEQHAVAIERLGIQVLRPLLPFNKERLTATCLASGTRWVEDETNKDPTLTARNALRHIFHNHRVPTAISKPALLQLAQRVTDKVHRREAEVNDLLSKLDGVLDIRSGELAIRYPRVFWPPAERQSPFKPESPFKRDFFNEEEGKIIAAMLLRRLTNLVTPRETLDLSQLKTAVRYLFPRLYIDDDTLDPTEETPHSFTAGGALFELLQAPGDYFPYYTWNLSRAPYPRDEFPTLRVPPLPGFRDEDDIGFEQSHPNTEQPFELFDGRFWLRVYNPSNRHLIIRPFRPTDLKPFRNSLEGLMKERFEALRVDSAKSKARFTLPAIAAPNDDGSDYVIAMPTFGVKINSGEAASEWEDLKWNVRYKKMDMSCLVRDSWEDYPEAIRRREEEEMEKERERAWEAADEDIPFVDMEVGEGHNQR